MRTDRGALRGALFSLGVLALASGCPGTLDDKERFLSDGGVGGCGDVPARLFVPACGGTGCHGSKSPQQGLDLESPGVAARVVGQRATTCVGILADPKQASQSLLYTKLLDAPGCGARMPLARPALSDADAACILAWIAAQAPATTDGGGAQSVPATNE